MEVRDAKDDGYERLFSKLAPAEAPASLFSAVLERIACERQAGAAKRRIAIFSFFSIASLIAFAAVMPTLRADFAKSEFFRDLSLLLTDPGAVLAVWKEYLLSMLESLPAAALAAAFAAAFALTASLNILVRSLAALTHALPAKHGRHSHV